MYVNVYWLYFKNWTSLDSKWTQFFQLLDELDQVSLTFEARKLFEADTINCDILLNLINRIGAEGNQYGISPLVPLFSLRDKMKFDPSIHNILRVSYNIKINKMKALYWHNFPIDRNSTTPWGENRRRRPTLSEV